MTDADPSNAGPDLPAPDLPPPGLPGPKISVVVIVHRMRAQAMNTLLSLSTDYQQGVGADDYEVVVVENRSDEVLDQAEVEALAGRFRYVLRDEPGVSPAGAINAGLALARAPVIGLMIDGARLLTPGVLHHALMAQRIDEGAVVAVPGYQLGPAMQHLDPAHTAETDRALLAQAGWPASGYGVFRVASMSWANRAGLLRPFIESNCLFLPRRILRDIGDADERFDLPGGGALNLYLFRRAVTHPDARYVVLAGEGSFHQVHGGVTTTPKADRETLLDAVKSQLDALLGAPFQAPDAAPILLGTLPPQMAPFLEFTAERFSGYARRTAGRHLIDLAPIPSRAEIRASRGATAAVAAAPAATPAATQAAAPASPAPAPAAPAEAPRFPMSVPFIPPSVTGFRPLHRPFSTWVGHQPFGYDLVAALRPRLLVELGTQHGLSYFTFCQAMLEGRVDGVAYAVDTWKGDEHTKAYDEEVFETVRKQNRHYAHFSYLMRMLFQDALAHFSDGTIDLLHIDGLHTYEAVSEDFRLWSPKVRPGGIILFHDVRARLMDFGAWRFWDEVEREHETFAFNHGFGLGVLRMPGGDRSADPDLVRLLFEGSKADGGEALRAFYVHAVRFHELSREAERAQAKKAERAAQAPAAQAPATQTPAAKPTA